MDTNNSCGICLSIYDHKERRPLLLPCSHSFCQACLQVLELRGDKSCSYCRQCWGSERVQDLLCCFQLIPSTDGGDRMGNITLCNTHEDAETSMWCQSCSCQICVKCLRASHQACDWVLIEEKRDSLREACDKMAADLAKMAAYNRATVEGIDSLVDRLLKCRDEQTSQEGSARTKMAECARLNQAAGKFPVNEFQKRYTEIERITQQLRMSETASASTLLLRVLKAFLAAEDGKTGTFIAKLQEMKVTESPMLANLSNAEESRSPQTNLTALSSQNFGTDASRLPAPKTSFPVPERASPRNKTAATPDEGLRAAQYERVDPDASRLPAPKTSFPVPERASPRNTTAAPPDEGLTAAQYERVDLSHAVGWRGNFLNRNFLVVRKPAATNSKIICSSRPMKKFVKKKAVPEVVERSAANPDRHPLPPRPQHLNNQLASTASTVQEAPPFLNGATWCINDNTSVTAAAKALQSVVFPSEIRITDSHLNGNQLISLLTSVSMTPCNVSLKLFDAFLKPSPKFASVSSLSSQGKTWAREELLVKPTSRCTLTEFWGHLDDKSLRKLPRTLKVVGLVLQDKKDMDIFNQLVEVDSGRCVIKKDWYFLKKIHLSISRGFQAEHFKVNQKTRSLFATGGSSSLDTAPDDAEIGLHLDALDSDDLHWGRQVLERVAETGNIRELFLHGIRLPHHDLRKFLLDTGNLLFNRASVTIHLPSSYQDRLGLWIIKNCLTAWDL